jgi:hypothetical protein
MTPEQKKYFLELLLDKMKAEAKEFMENDHPVPTGKVLATSVMDQWRTHNDLTPEDLTQEWDNWLLHQKTHLDANPDEITNAVKEGGDKFYQLAKTFVQKICNTRILIDEKEKELTELMEKYQKLQELEFVHSLINSITKLQKCHKE